MGIKKKIRDCKVNRLGVRSNHDAIMTQFRLTAIKFNNDHNDITITNWQKIQTEKIENSILNTKLFDLTVLTDTSALRYTEFNANILSAAQDTATKQNSKKRGWFHHSDKNLLLIIANRNYLIHHLRNQDPTLDLTDLRLLLKYAQTQVTGNISLAKSAWSSHQVDPIHSMQHTPKTAWESVKVLADGMSSHHKAPTVMRFKLPNGNLAATDAENASILGPHFERVYTNHQNIDWAVLDDILHLLTMLLLDAEITW